MAILFVTGEVALLKIVNICNCHKMRMKITQITYSMVGKLSRKIIVGRLLAHVNEHNLVMSRYVKLIIFVASTNKHGTEIGWGEQGNRY